jgi:hypothetical protein
MATLADEIARCLADGRCSTAMAGSGKRYPGSSLNDEDKAFLRRWADALVQSEWKRNAEKFVDPDRLIWGVFTARRLAEDDHGKQRANEELWQSLQKHQALANMADLVLDHYEWLAEGAGGITDELAYLIECQTVIVRDLHKDFFVIYERIYGDAPKVHFSTHSSTRERMLFMQYMSRDMKQSLDEWHDDTVAAIASLMYEVPVSRKAVERARSRQ